MSIDNTSFLPKRKEKGGYTHPPAGSKGNRSDNPEKTEEQVHLEFNLAH